MWSWIIFRPRSRNFFVSESGVTRLEITIDRHSCVGLFARIYIVVLLTMCGCRGWSGRPSGWSCSRWRMNSRIHCQSKFLEKFFQKNGPTLASFIIYFWSFSNKHHYNFYNKYMWKNVHPVYSTGIWTHDLRNVSLLPYPLDKSLLQFFCIVWKLFEFTHKSSQCNWFAVD